ncbi:ParA family protein, partial [Mesorhizobium sp. M2A.F.Ca.ET.017.03.2.1]
MPEQRAVQITVASPKGGVGKTMTTILLAGEFAAAGHRVTVLDTDPQ